MMVSPSHALDPRCLEERLPSPCRKSFRLYGQFMVALDLAGEWWLPSQPDRKIGGRLTYSPDDGIELELIGLLNKDSADSSLTLAIEPDQQGSALTASGNYGRLHGQVSTTAYTLDGCFQVRSHRNLLGGTPTETIHANQLYRGAWYEPDETVVASKLRCRLLHLPYWITTSALNTTWSHPVASVGETQAIVAITRVPDISIPLREGYRACIVQTIGTSGDGITRSSIEQYLVLTIEAPSTTDYLDLMAFMQDVQDVLSVAFNRTACIEEVSLFDPALTRGEGKGSRQIPVEVVARWSDRDGWREPRLLTEYDRFFSYEDIGGAPGLAELVDTATRFRSELRRVMATRSGRSMFPSDRLVNRSAALESLDKERTGYSSSSLRTRLRRCAELAGEPFSNLVGDVESWIARFKDRRDLHAHHLERSPDDGGFIDVVLADTAYILFVLCLLRTAEAPKEVFDRLPCNSEYLWLRSQVHAILPPPE